MAFLLKLVVGYKWVINLIYFIDTKVLIKKKWWTILITNTEEIAGKEITENLGLVKGNKIRARHIGNDIMAALRNIVGGEVKEYTKMISDTREDALKEMVKEAEKMGADAVVNVRFSTSQVMGGAAEILAYGTAVKLK